MMMTMQCSAHLEVCHQLLIVCAPSEPGVSEPVVQVGQAGTQGEAVTPDDLINDPRPQDRVPGHVQPPHLHQSRVEAPLRHPVQLSAAKCSLGKFLKPGFFCFKKEPK